MNKVKDSFYKIKINEESYNRIYNDLFNNFSPSRNKKNSLFFATKKITLCILFIVMLAGLKYYLTNLFGINGSIQIKETLQYNFRRFDTLSISLFLSLYVKLGIFLTLSYHYYLYFKNKYTIKKYGYYTLNRSLNKYLFILPTVIILFLIINKIEVQHIFKPILTTLFIFFSFTTDIKVFIDKIFFKSYKDKSGNFYNLNELKLTKGEYLISNSKLSKKDSINENNSNPLILYIKAKGFNLDKFTYHMENLEEINEIGKSKFLRKINNFENKTAFHVILYFIITSYFFLLPATLDIKLLFGDYSSPFVKESPIASSKIINNDGNIINLNKDTQEKIVGYLNSIPKEAQLFIGNDEKLKTIELNYNDGSKGQYVFTKSYLLYYYNGSEYNYFISDPNQVYSSQFIRDKKNKNHYEHYYRIPNYSNILEKLEEITQNTKGGSNE